VTTQAWLLLAAGIVFAAVGYRYSLSRHPTRDCHWCTGWGRHRGAVWTYAKGECTGRTVLPPRARCDRGQVPRWGRRVLRIGGK
jgi:hypothetical protein